MFPFCRVASQLAQASQPYQYGVFFVHSDPGYFRCNRSNASRL
jgi:hypothetical protein